MHRTAEPSCRALRQLLLEGLEGRLDARAGFEVAAHVERCASCADELADLAATRHAVRRALGRYRVRARVAPTRARLRGAAPERAGALDRLAAFAWRPAQQALALAAVLAIFVATSGIGEPSRDGELIADRVSAALARQRVLDLAELRATRGRQEPSVRIPVSDDLVIDAVLDEAEGQPAGPPDRSVVGN